MACPQGTDKCDHSFVISRRSNSGFNNERNNCRSIIPETVQLNYTISSPQNLVFKINLSVEPFLVAAIQRRKMMNIILPGGKVIGEEVSEFLCHEKNEYLHCIIIFSRWTDCFCIFSFIQLVSLFFASSWCCRSRDIERETIPKSRYQHCIHQVQSTNQTF